MTEIAFATTDGRIIVWDPETNSVLGSHSLGIAFTDLATAPDGQVYAITGTSLYKVDLQRNSTELIGAMTGAIYAGFSAQTDATGFDIGPDGTALVSAGNHFVLTEINLSTGAVVNVGLVDAYSAGDVLIEGNSVFVSTATNLEELAETSNGAYRTVGDEFGVFAVTGLVSAPGEFGSPIGFKDNVAYDLSIPNATLGLGVITTFNLGGATITGATTLGSSAPPPEPDPLPDAEILVYASNGGVWLWNTGTGSFTSYESSGLGATDIAVAPDGRLYAITGTSLYEIGTGGASDRFVGTLLGFENGSSFGVGDAQAFDISTSGLALIASSNSSLIYEVSLTTATVSVVGTMGSLTSAGDLVISGDSVFVTTNSGTLAELQQIDGFYQLVDEQDISTGSMTGLAGPISDDGRLIGFDGLQAFDIALTEDFRDDGLLQTFSTANGIWLTGATVLSGRVGPPPPDQKTSQELFEEFGENAFLADLALSAYHLEDREVEAWRVNNKKLAAEASYGEAGNDLRYLTEEDLPALALTSSGDPNFPVSGLSNGIYSNGNAAFLVARSADGLFLSFRGTNDNANTGIPLVGVSTPDEGHWIGKDDHFALLSDALAVLRAYIEDPVNGIDNVYVTGHSLGGGMVEALVDEWDDIDLIATTYAGSGYGLPDDLGDPRLTNFRLDGDPIIKPSYVSDNDGDMNTIFHNISDDVLDGGSLGNVSLHSMSLYAAFMDFFVEEGLDRRDFRKLEGRDYDRFYAFEDTSKAGIQIGTGDDFIVGSGKRDVILGGKGADVIYAATGDDYVVSGNGPDTVYLGWGDDWFEDNDQTSLLGIDTVYGDTGDDTIMGAGGDDVFRGQSGQDVIYGGAGNDLIFGGNNKDLIKAGSGADRVYDGKGRDTVYLGGGNDVFFDSGQTGLFGRDLIFGGSGADTFVFGGAMSEDVIGDFERKTDTLVLDRAIFAEGTTRKMIVDDFASVTEDGVLLDIADGSSILLIGLDATEGLQFDLQFA